MFMKTLRTIILTLIILVFISSITMADKVPIGTKLGEFSKMDKAVYLNGVRLQGYIVDDEMAICIEDLKHCGFNTEWDNIEKRSIFEYKGEESISRSNIVKGAKIEGDSIIEADIEVYLDGDKIKPYSTGEYCLVKIQDLEEFGQVYIVEEIIILINDAILDNPEIVKFEDKELQRIVRNKLNRPYGRIYKESLLGIESIVEEVIDDKYLEELMPSVPGEKLVVEDLSGIEYLTNLKELSLIGTRKPEDSKLLKELSNLEKLQLKVPLEFDLEFLNELNYLEELRIDTTESVKAIGQLTNIKKLSISTEAYDLSPLSNLKNLTELSIEKCNTEKKEVFKFLRELKALKKLKLNIEASDLIKQEASISYIKEMDNLEELELNLGISEGTEDLSYLMDYTNLTKLSIHTSGKISPIEGIDHLESLKELKLDGGGIVLKDTASLGELIHLEKLDMFIDEEENIDFLKNMTKLKELYILKISEKAMSLKPLENLKNLKTLKISAGYRYDTANDKKWNDIDSLSGLNQLENMQLASLKIDDISWIKNLSNLKTVELSDNSITDISPMSSLKNIEEIDLSSNEIGNIEAIIHDNLKVLDCGDNKIESIIFTEKMPKLKALDLSVNNLKTIKGIENISDLEKLGLRANSIDDINFLKDMINLKELDLSGNNIKDIYPIINLSYLEKLGIGGNDIQDITPIYKLRYLKLLCISENNKEEFLSDDQLWEYIPKLDRIYVDYGRIFPRFQELGRINSSKNSKTTYKGEIYIGDDVTLPKEGLVVKMYAEKRGKYWNLSETEVTEILVPYGESSIEYEFSILNYLDMGFQSRSIKFKTEDPRYELKSNYDFEIYSTTNDQVKYNCDIRISERAKISGKLILDDEILNMNLGDEGYDIREAAVYVRINGEKRRVKLTVDLNQKEIDYEVYIPKEYAGQKLALECIIKKTGYIDFQPHMGVVGEILTRGFVTAEKTLSPNIDEGIKILFSGEEMVIDDILIQL